MLQNFLSYLFWIIMVLLQTSKCRRYDIEQEAQNLYSTNLRSVIERFRRTPDYLKILKDQIDILRSNTDAIIDSTIYYYSNKLQEKVSEFFGGNVTQNLRTIRHLQLNRMLRRSRKKLRNYKNIQGDDKGLDDYKKFRSTLSLEEKNHMKDLGFEFAGSAIHAMISSMLPDGALPTSTLLPDGGGSPGISSTIQHHGHEVTQNSSPVTEQLYTTATIETATIETITIETTNLYDTPTTNDLS